MMRIHHRYHISLFWSDEDECWIADVPDLTHCSAHGPTPEAALAQVETAIAGSLACRPRRGSRHQSRAIGRPSTLHATPRDRLWSGEGHTPPPADGAIIPLIPGRPDGSYDLTRLVVEKVASINTTEAGGNASLMSLAGE